MRSCWVGSRWLGSRARHPPRSPWGRPFAGADQSCYGGPDGATWFQTASPNNQYLVSGDGVITSWSYQADSAPFSQMQLKLASPQDGVYEPIFESDIETPAANTLNTFPTQISIQGPGAPLLLGFWATTPTPGANCLRFGTGDYGLVSTPGNVPLFYDASLPWVTYPLQLDVSAVLEPDADNDDFGDESQDTCLPPAVRTDCDPPETTITKAPKLALAMSPNHKLARRPVKLKFRSDERGSIFECRLDRNRFKPCESPFRKRLKTGRSHRFKVRATDAGGNVDPSPAKRKFRLAA